MRSQLMVAVCLALLLQAVDTAPTPPSPESRNQPLPAAQWRTVREANGTTTSSDNGSGADLTVILLVVLGCALGMIATCIAMAALCPGTVCHRAFSAGQADDERVLSGLETAEDVEALQALEKATLAALKGRLKNVSLEQIEATWNSFILPRTNIKLTSEVIGKGAFGTVRLAWLMKPGQPAKKVALKIPQPDAEQNMITLATEARLLALLHHPNIVALAGAVLSGPQPGLALELVRPGDLKTLLRDRGVAALGGVAQATYRVTTIGRDIASALR